MIVLLGFENKYNLFKSSHLQLSDLYVQQCGERGGQPEVKWKGSLVFVATRNPHVETASKNKVLCEVALSLHRRKESLVLLLSHRWCSSQLLQTAILEGGSVNLCSFGVDSNAINHWEVVFIFFPVI